MERPIKINLTDCFDQGTAKAEHEPSRPHHMFKKERKINNTLKLKGRNKGSGLVEATRDHQNQEA
jgi:hypothetical protein